jgi:hypothetical protein
VSAAHLASLHIRFRCPHRLINSPWKPHCSCMVPGTRLWLCRRGQPRNLNLLPHVILVPDSLPPGSLVIKPSCSWTILRRFLDSPMQADDSRPPLSPIHKAPPTFDMQMIVHPRHFVHIRNDMRLPSCLSTTGHLVITCLHSSEKPGSTHYYRWPQYIQT